MAASYPQSTKTNISRSSSGIGMELTNSCSHHNFVVVVEAHHRVSRESRGEDHIKAYILRGIVYLGRAQVTINHREKNLPVYPGICG